jgi:hypothetical protein
MLRRSVVVLFLALGIAVVADSITAGKYTGKWDGASGASGDFTLTLTADAGGQLKPAVLFTLGGQEVKCTVKSSEVNGSKIKVVYAFDLQGTALESAIEGDLSGNRLAGKYQTHTPDGQTVDEGTWETTASK